MYYTVGHNHRTGMSIWLMQFILSGAKQEYRVREFTCGACHVDEASKTEATFLFVNISKMKNVLKRKLFTLLTRYQIGV